MRKSLLGRSAYIVSIAILIGLNGLHDPPEASALDIVDTVSPAVSSIAITSDAGEYSTYTIGDSIKVTVTFSEDVVVTGSPQLELAIGGTAKTASYDSVDGSAAVFIYVVQEGDSDEDGIGIGADKLTLNGGTIQDGNGNAANLAYEAVATDAAHKVDTMSPVISSIAITSDAGEYSTYAIGDSIKVTVTFSEDVVVTGSPQLELAIGEQARMAAYNSTEGAAAVFIYVVQEGDSDEDGIGIGPNKLSLNGGTIKDQASNDANLDRREAVADDSAHKVDGVYPTLLNDVVAWGEYITLNFSETITVPEILRTISSSVNVDLGQFYIAVISVTVDGDLVKPSSATINDAQLRLNLAASVTQSQRVNVAYDNIFARDAVGLFIDRVGNPLQNFSSTPVSNVSNVPDAEESDVKDLVLSLTELRVTEGESGTYTVKLEAQPSDSVNVYLSSSSNKLSVNPGVLIFTADNWNTAQTVTLSAHQDDDDLNYWVLVETYTGSSGGDYESAFLVVIDDDDDD